MANAPSLPPAPFAPGTPTDAGDAAESAVAEALVGAGWRLLARQWRGGGGEIDLVVERAGFVRFVEVKLRAPDDPLSDEAVSPSKQARLRQAARAWFLLHGEPAREACFTVAILAADGAVRWIDDAFDG